MTVDASRFRLLGLEPSDRGRHRCPIGGEVCGHCGAISGGLVGVYQRLEVAPVRPSEGELGGAAFGA